MNQKNQGAAQVRASGKLKGGINNDFKTILEESGI